MKGKSDKMMSRIPKTLRQLSTNKKGYRWPPTVFLFILIIFQHLQNKNVDFGGIRTWIAGVELEHTDHLTNSTTANAILCKVVSSEAYLGKLLNR